MIRFKVKDVVFDGETFVPQLLIAGLSDREIGTILDVVIIELRKRKEEKRVDFGRSTAMRSVRVLSFKGFPWVFFVVDS